MRSRLTPVELALAPVLELAVFMWSDVFSLTSDDLSQLGFKFVMWHKKNGQLVTFG